MKTRHILVCLTLSLLGTGLQAQNELPQVFSPNAAELGKYGKVPVSYFNGLPNISIPLTELHAKGYTLPIYLTYHAGGNKPDQHPGWVGLGWTLHAGGCINRVVHGMKDEIDYNEMCGIWGESYSLTPGYLYNAPTFQQNPIDTTILSIAYNHPSYDMNPDEFQVNFQGLNSSFYLTSTNSARIVSSDGLDYLVNVEVEPYKPVDIYGNDRFPASQYAYISTIQITSNEGIVYRFGGSDDAIEFNYELDPGSVGAHTNLKREPITWNISSIIFPWGERINFEYVRAGMPVVTLDRHYYEYCAYDPEQPENSNGYIVNTHLVANSNLNYLLLSPSYLHRIYSEMTDEEVLLTISPSVEKEDELNTTVFASKFANQLDHFPLTTCLSQNKYQKLDRIDSPRDTIFLGYSSSSQERLKLMELSFNSKSEKKYGMRYNSQSLPDYHSRSTDPWGFFSQSSILDGNGPYYQVGENAMKAEILEALEYPTGGETRFYYEAHRYGQVVSQYPFLLTPEAGTAGGLRLKKLVDVSDGKEYPREYRYLTDEGASSGILAAKPRYYAEGTLSLGFDGLHDWVAPLVYVNIDSVKCEAPFILSGERMLNQIPLTSGCHVTYSRVEELFPDSGKTVYWYSNHEDNPDEPFIQGYTNYEDYGLYNSFSSNSLSRGLLLRKETYRRNKSTPVQVEENEYSRDTVNYIQGIDQIAACRGIMRRSEQIRYYTYYPRLEKKTITTFPDGNGQPCIETTVYSYDSHRRLTGTTRKNGGATERDAFTYTGEYAVHPYSGMALTNMIAYPVEHLKFRKDTLQAEKLVSAELTTWTQSDSLFMPSAQYKAALGSGIAPSSFDPYDGNAKDSRYGTLPEVSFTKYDRNGNIVLSEDRSGRATSYVWTPDGCHPAAIFTGAKRGYTRYISNDISRVKNYHFDPDDPVSLDFESLAPFTLRIWLMCPNYQCWDLSPVVDGNAHRIVCVNDPQAPNPWPAHASSYPSPLEIPLSAGSHTLRIPVSNHFYVANSPDPAGYTLEINYKEKQTTAQQVSGQTVVFEDFEDETGAQVPAGYNSGKSHRGSWTHSLDTSGGPYVVDYRVYRNGKWNYVRQSASGSSVTISEGTAPIDHVRIYPLGSMPESYTWNDDGTLRSRTDSRGLTESYRYDGLGRLTGVYDNDGKKVEGYQYNYKNR